MTAPEIGYAVWVSCTRYSGWAASMHRHVMTRGWRSRDWATTLCGASGVGGSDGPWRTDTSKAPCPDCLRLLAENGPVQDPAVTLYADLRVRGEVTLPSAREGHHDALLGRVRALTKRDGLAISQCRARAHGVGRTASTTVALVDPSDRTTIVRPDAALDAGLLFPPEPNYCQEAAL